MKKLLTTLFNIEPGEEKLVFLNFLQSVFMGFPKLFTLMTANSLFLERYSASDLPYIYLISSIVVPVVGFIHLFFEKRLSFFKLQSGTLIALSFTSFAFLVLLFTEQAWVIIALYIWLAVEMVMSDLILWSAANRMFTARQSKRLFGLIGAGGIITVIIGGFITPYIVPFIGTRGLLMLSLSGFLFALVNLRHMNRCFKDKFAGIVNKNEPSETPQSQSIWAMFQNRYLVLIFLIFAFFSQTVFYFVDNIFYHEMSLRYPNADLLASFIGQFWAVYGIFSLLFRSFIAGRWIMMVGILGGLLTSQLMVAICMAGILAVSSFDLPIAKEIIWIFWLVAATKQVERILTGSVTLPAYHTLYQPLSMERRVRVQTVTESIVGPVGGMLTSLLLLLLTKVLNLQLVELAGILLVIVCAYAIACLFTIKAYRQALTTALNRRGLIGSDLSLDDPSSLQILEKGMQSRHPKEVLYCLKLLEEVKHYGLNDYLFKLINHSSAEVREEAYHMIERLAPDGGFERLKNRLLVEESPVLRAALFRAIAATGETEALDLIEQYLNDSEIEVRRGAMVALIRYCGIEGAVRAGSSLMELQKSRDHKEREFAATVIGQIGIPTFYRGLLPLLNDENMTVRKAALRAAGYLDNRKLWLLVIDGLTALSTREAAVKALLLARESAFPALENVYADKQQSPKLRREIIHLYGRIKSKQAISLLLKKLNEPDRTLRYEILWSLYLCGYQAFEKEREIIERLMIEEVFYGVRVMSVIKDLQEADDLGMLLTALNYELDKTRLRMFLLLTAIYPAELIMRIWSNFIETSAEKRDLALELLDNTVHKEHKAIVLPLMEMTQQSQSHMPQISSADPLEWVTEIILQPQIWNNTWLRTCAIDSLTCLLSPDEIQSLLTSILNDDDELIRETVLYVLNTLDPSVLVVNLNNRLSAYPTIEKVKILKTVSIFSEIPDEILAEVVPFLEGVELQAGQTVFYKGDLGTSMYVIVDGLLRVHDGDTTLAELGKGHIFGEFSALDPEPRTASVTTIQPSYLFQLSQEELNVLIEGHIEVAKGIIQILCQRLRNSLKIRGQKVEHRPQSSSDNSVSLDKNLSGSVPSYEGELSLIEKVIILKTVSIFADTPDNILSEVARLTKQIHLNKGEMLFKKGDVGTSMYIVVDGKVRVHDGDQLIAELGERALIGEMAVLSSEPRTASVTATSNTTLLSLTQTSLLELMWDQHRIVRGIIEVLIQRLRSLR